MTSTPQVVNKFRELTGADETTSRFFLESSGWDVDLAVSAFFDNDGALPAPGPASTTLPSISSAPPPSSTHTSAPRRSTPSATSKRGGVVGFSDLASTSADKEGQTYFTGGEKSGMVVQDPGEQDTVNQVLAKARANSGSAPPDLEQETVSQPSFTGAGKNPYQALRLYKWYLSPSKGYRLGQTHDPSARVPGVQPQTPKSVTKTLTFWQEGFTIDDGPLRRYDDPSNAAFLNDVNQGQVPTELEDSVVGSSLRINIVDKKDESYKAPPQKLQPFSGRGQVLGSTSATQTPTATSATAAGRSSTGSKSFSVDDSRPTTTLQIRLADGTRLVSKFNLDHTIADIYNFVDRSVPRKISYVLQTTFPVQPLTDRTKSIQEAGLLNAVVIQKPL
ncbi:hypothetical protein QOT17_007929 [Balamuthia mandrillaris]